MMTCGCARINGVWSPCRDHAVVSSEQQVIWLKAENDKLLLQINELRKLQGHWSTVELALKDQDRKDRLIRRWEEAVNMFCSCGGGEPGHGCAMCDAYHWVKETATEKRNYEVFCPAVFGGAQCVKPEGHSGGHDNRTAKW